MSVAEMIGSPTCGDMKRANTGGMENYIALPVSPVQRALVLDALRVFSRRSEHAYAKGRIGRILPVPRMSGKILLVPRDPEVIQMFIVSVRILILRDHTNGMMQAIEGLVSRLTKEALKDPAEAT